jgi:hypothetical protein
MWSSIHLSALPVWGEVSYTVTATWRDDHEAEPVTLTRSGIAQVHPHDDPIGMLQAVLSCLNQTGLEQSQAPGGSSRADS